MSSFHTIIIGAGIVGVSAAYELARRGQLVTLLDMGAVGNGASFGNAGIIAVGHPPLPRPGLIWKTIKWMLDGGSPLYVPPRLDPSLIRWMWDFRQACNAAHFDRCMRVLTDLGIESKKCFDRIVAEESLDCEYQDAGWIEVFLTPQGLEHGRVDAGLLRRQGLTVDEWTGAELRKRQPAFRPEVHAALHYKDSAFANPYMYLKGLADRAAELGAVIRTGSEVKDILLEDKSFRGVRLASGEQVTGDVLVLAAGSWTTRLARTIGLSVPMQAGKGYHVNLKPRSAEAAAKSYPTVACVLAETYVAVTPMGHGLRLAGTVELSGINSRLVQRRLDMLSVGAERYLNGLDDSTIESRWCGMRPCTADGLPVIGWSPRVSGVFIATGHAKMGFALGPITGLAACQSILGEGTSVDLEPYSPTRYGGGAARVPALRPAMEEAGSRS